MITLCNLKTRRQHILPDRLYYEVPSSTYEVFFLKMLNLNLIKTVYLIFSLWEIQRKREQIKCHHSEAIRQIRMRDIFHDNKPGLFNKSIAEMKRAMLKIFKDSGDTTM